MPAECWMPQLPRAGAISITESNHQYCTHTAFKYYRIPLGILPRATTSTQPILHFQYSAISITGQAASWVEHALSHWRPCLGRCISWNSEVTKLHNAILSGPPHTRIVSQVQIQIQRQVFLRHTLDKMRVWTHHPHHWWVIRLIQCWPIPMIPIITKLQATKLHNGTPHRDRGARGTIVEIQMQVKNNYIFKFKCTFIKFGIISWASWLESLSEVLLHKRCYWGPSAL